jgi:hypothetical protein
MSEVNVQSCPAIFKLISVTNARHDDATEDDGNAPPKLGITMRATLGNY